MTAATVDTAEIAANVRTEIAAMPDRYAATALYSGREMRAISQMLDDAVVTYTANTVTVQMGHGDPSLMATVATVLLDRASIHLPVEADGEIVEDDDYAFTLKF